MRVRKFLIFLLLNIIGVRGYKILGVFPLGAKSHNIFCQSVTKTLAKRGHQVDVIVSQKLENPPSNYKVIFNILEIVQHQLLPVDMTVKEMSTNYSSDPIKFISHRLGNFLCELLANEKMQKMIEKLKGTFDYDVLITEVLLKF